VEKLPKYNTLTKGGDKKKNNTFGKRGRVSTWKRAGKGSILIAKKGESGTCISETANLCLWWTQPRVRYCTQMGRNWLVQKKKKPVKAYFWWAKGSKLMQLRAGKKVRRERKKCPDRAHLPFNKVRGERSYGKDSGPLIKQIGKKRSENSPG